MGCVSKHVALFEGDECLMQGSLDTFLAKSGILFAVSVGRIVDECIIRQPIVVDLSPK
jgi:hypothetical protein